MHYIRTMWLYNISQYFRFNLHRLCTVNGRSCGWRCIWSSNILQLYCGIGLAIVLLHWPCDCTVALALQLYCGIGLAIVLWHWPCNCTVALALQLYCCIGLAIVLLHWPCDCTVALALQLYCGIGLAIVLWHWPCNCTVALALQLREKSGINFSHVSRHNGSYIYSQSWPFQNQICRRSDRHITMHSAHKPQYRRSCLTLTSVSTFQHAPLTAHNLALLPASFSFNIKSD